MEKIKKTSLADRFKNAVNAFRCKPISQIHYGVELKRCDECESRIMRERIYAAYKLAVEIRDTGKYLYIEDVIGYLGEALE